MFKIVEIILISLAGAGAVFFFIIRFIKNARSKNKCSGCGLSGYYREHIKKE